MKIFEHIKKHWIVYLVSLIAFLLLIKYLKDRNNPNPTDGSSGGFFGGSGSSSESDAINKELVLSRGATGANVKMLQGIFNEISWTEDITEDGVFGAETENASLSILGQPDATIEEAEYKLHMS